MMAAVCNYQTTPCHCLSCRCRFGPTRARHHQLPALSRTISLACRPCLGRSERRLRRLLAETHSPGCRSRLASRLSRYTSDNPPRSDSHQNSGCSSPSHSRFPECRQRTPRNKFLQDLRAASAWESVVPADSQRQGRQSPCTCKERCPICTRKRTCGPAAHKYSNHEHYWYCRGSHSCC